MNKIKADIVVIGAGITGCALARQLSRYKAKILVIDKEADVSCGTTKANTGLIHPGYTGEEGTLRLSITHKGNLCFRKNAPELDIPIKCVGSLLTIFKVEQIKILEHLLQQGKKYGVTGLEVILNKNGDLKKLEPNISDKVIAALYCKEHYLTSPYEAAIALYENARMNSVDFMFSSEVYAIDYDKTKKLFFIDTTSFDPDLNSRVSHNRIVEADYLINAAGIFADNIARMIGDATFNITAIKGQYYLLDNEASDLVRRPVMRMPDEENARSKGMVVSPTYGNNILVGSTDEITSKYDFSTTKNELDDVKEKLSQMVTGIPFNKVITSFAGLRAVSDNADFIIAPSLINNKFINVAGIQSPGLTCCFAISEMVIDIMKDLNIALIKNQKFVPQRKRINKFSENTFEGKTKLYDMNNKYGEIICRCEKVTEAEIVEAIKRGATTLDGIKFRTRAGMGRCQGGYCTLKVMKILSRELGLSFDKITKCGEDSYIAKYKI